MKENMYLRLKTDGTSDFVELPEENFLDAAYAALGCTFIEFAQTRVSDLVLMVDEFGLLKDDFEVNYMASDLYVGDLIVGDAILCRRFGPDIVPVSLSVLTFVNIVFDLGLDDLEEPV